MSYGDELFLKAFLLLFSSLASLFDNDLLSGRVLDDVSLVRLVAGLDVEKKDDVRMICLSKHGLFSNSLRSRLVLFKEASSELMEWQLEEEPSA